MTAKRQLPMLPHGSPSIFSGLSESFSFHSSPEAFITSRVLAFRSSNPSLADSRVPIRAKILNRNIAVVSSYGHVQQILCDTWDNDCAFSAGQAYDELMAPFFKSPNLLLTDPPTHAAMRILWDERIRALVGRSRIKCQEVTLGHLRDMEPGSSMDIYESVKALSWKILLSVFVAHTESSIPPLNTEQDDLRRIEVLQEDLLRGQFSLFPVSVNAKLWRSPRSRGLQARKELQSLFRARIQKAPNQCPIIPKTAKEEEDIASHTLLFTSSLAAKGLASLLTALLLNLYVYRAEHASWATLAEKLTGITSEYERDKNLRSICLETERLSPPVVGIMRRTTKDVILTPSHENKNAKQILVPKSWDVWLYFVAAARDPAVFGPSAETFVPERYCSFLPDPDEVKEGFAFGAGPKACLGKHLMRELAVTVAKTYLGILPGLETQERYTLQASRDSIPLGVQAWLGWQSNIEPEQWAKDMKQLPTQRPTRGIKVQLRRGPAEAALSDLSDDLSDTEWYDAHAYME